MPNTPSPKAADVGLATKVLDQASRDRAVDRFRENGIRLPTFAELKNPKSAPEEVKARAAATDRSKPEADNLYRVHWYNQIDGNEITDVPEHIELPSSLTGVKARIVLAFGDRFPMITAHKVLAAYTCLVPRLVTGRFDPTAHRAIWPSTGNYARGGVAISRIMGCRGVAVLPAGMSQERFDWLNEWCLDPEHDIIRTPGTESNVREIYEACAQLALDPENVIINQFSEFANYLGHREVTGDALDTVYKHLNSDGTTRLAAFVAATGSAGTIGAGDHLKELYGSQIVAAEALECPTMLENGFGEHNIQGIGDKHIPLIHNVQNTDAITAISDSATDQLDVLFQTDVGRTHLAKEFGLDEEILDSMQHFGYSSFCNMLSAIAYAKRHNLDENDMVITVATDGSAMYNSGRQPIIDRDFGGTFTEADAAVVVARHLEDPTVHTLVELDQRGRDRIFNLGYFTWVEQLGIDIDTFEARRSQSWWDGLVPAVAAWDELILDFNERTGLA